MQGNQRESMVIPTGKVTYHQQISLCGKENCRKCREGKGHGPYWYSYKTVNGRTVRTYIGKDLPTEIKVSLSTQNSSFPDQMRVPSDGVMSSPLIRFSVLGPLQCERALERGRYERVTDVRLRHHNVRLVLACLLSYPNRLLGREQVLDMLWPDLEVETAQARLDRVVYDLRQIVEPQRVYRAQSELVITSREMVSLALQDSLWVDADAFEEEAKRVYACDDMAKREYLLEQALALYTGSYFELLAECDVDVVLSRREALRRVWVGLLLELSDLRVSRNALTSAVAPLQELLVNDPGYEAAATRLMKVFVQLGHRGEALRVYKRLSLILKQEYHLKPLEETRKLAAEIQHGGSGLLSVRTEQGSSRARLAQALPVPFGRDHQGPLVGREREMARLRALLAEVEYRTQFRLSGQKKVHLPDQSPLGQCLLVVGEVGIGKTRLTEEMAKTALLQGWTAVWGRAYTQERCFPYRLWTEVLRGLMEQGRQGQWPYQEIYRRQLAFHPLSWLMPELAFPLVQPGEQEQLQGQLRLWEAVLEVLFLSCTQGPVLLILDDVQWADQKSCELLAYLSRRVSGHPLLIIGTCRDHELFDGHPLKPLLSDLQRERAVEVISLDALSNEQISALVSHVLTDISAPLIERVCLRAGGNPFFAEELAKSLESISSSVAGSSVVVPNHQEADAQIIPDTISAVLDLRLSRLSPACVRLLSHAAVLGGSFQLGTLIEMEENHSGEDESVVLELLEEALHAGMLTEEGTGVRVTYRFWHQLLMSHLYEKLSVARKALQHRRAAFILQKEYLACPEEGAATITHHLMRGGVASQKITHFAELAGNKAYRLSSYSEAEKYYRIAYEHADARDDQQEYLAYLCEFLGECTYVRGNHEEARRFYEQALEIYKQASSDSPQAVEKIQLQALLLCEIGTIWRDAGNNVQARACYEQGQRILREAGLEQGCAAWAKISHEQGHVYASEGNYEEARRILAEALRLFEKMKTDAHLASSSLIRRALSGDPINIGRVHWLLGLVESCAGVPASAIKHFKVALSLFEQHNHHRYIAIVNNDLGCLFLNLSRYEEARESFRRSLGLAERMGHVVLLSLGHGNLGEIDLRFGNLAEAEERFRKGLALVEQIGDRVNASLWHIFLAATLQEQGRIPDASASLYHALKLSRASHFLPYLAMALVAVGRLRIAQALKKEAGRDARLRRAKNTLQRALSCEGLEAHTRTEGLVALAQVNWLLGDIGCAEKQATQALALARQSELMRLVAYAQRILGELLAVRHQVSEAAQYFDQALKIFRQSGMHLEGAYTLQAYGAMLMQRSEGMGEDYQRGVEYLQEAQRVFVRCFWPDSLHLQDKAKGDHLREPVKV